MLAVLLGDVWVLCLPATEDLNSAETALTRSRFGLRGILEGGLCLFAAVSSARAENGQGSGWGQASVLLE